MLRLMYMVALYRASFLNVAKELNTVHFPNKVSTDMLYSESTIINWIINPIIAE